MKKVIFLLLVSFVSYSQDTIYKLSNEAIAAKILEINDQNIKFKKFSNLDGPLYSELKSEIYYIKYQNCSVDSVTRKNTVVASVNPSSSPSSSSVVIYKGRRYSDDEINMMINAYPNGEAKSLMQKKSTAMLEYKQRQHLSIGLGYGIGFAVPIVVTFGTLTTNNINYDNAVNTIVAGALIGAVIRIAGNVGFFINKNKKLNEKREILDLMNEGK